jgi:PLD-like domain
MIRKNFQKQINLNSLGILHTRGWESAEAENAHHSSVRHSSVVECHFRDLEDRLVEKIDAFPIVVGCMAWLTNERVLKALQRKSLVSIVVQKEDFLRPDSGDWSAKSFKNLYKTLPMGLDRESAQLCGVPLKNAAYHSGWQTEAIRCVGKFNKERVPAFPRMHNKFLVFCDGNLQEEEGFITPKSVWTGSFNATKNGTNSLENAVYLSESDAVKQYFQEWQLIFMLSEAITDIDWERNWVRPEFYIGT